MNEQTPQSWFIQRLAKEAFLIYAITWFILFLLEALKSGIVSHYISLPHAAIPLRFLGVLWLSLLPDSKQSMKEIDQLPILYLGIVSIVITVVLLFILDAVLPLTILIIFATLAAIWGGAYCFYKEKS